VSSPLRDKVADLPDGPGVYLFQDTRGKVIYVGKAKSLRKRVGSYLQSRANLPERTRSLVGEAADVEWLVTATEVEALVLENSLIKKNRPRYNVNLRDDKNFPHVRITTSEPCPRMEIARRARRDGDSYFGPFVPASTARRTMRLLGQHFGIRACKGPIEDKDHRACLYFHINQCLAPCTDACSPEEYDAAVEDALLFLRGHDEPLRRALEEKMRDASGKEAFERAAHYRDLLRMLEKRREPQRIASTGLEQQDAWGVHREVDRAMLVVGLVRDGVLRGRREFPIREAAGRDDAELLGDAVRQYYHGETWLPEEVLLPGRIDDAELTEVWLREQAGRAIRLHVPQRGAKADRVRWAGQNARVAFELKFARGEAAREAADELAEALELPGPAERIECVDISNMQGSDVVASLVVFVSGQPARREYRTFKVKGLSGQPDDYRSMAEVVDRRYRRLLTEGRELPDLLVVDGGKGQLGAAVRALDLLELGDLPAIGIAKKEELLHRRKGGEPLRLPRSSAALQLVQRIRDEAHRVAVTFHRSARSRRTVQSELDAVPGVGPARRRQLLRAFGSVDGVRSASLEALTEVVGPRLARRVKAHLPSTTS
jgi:excinuclease ABC subunit C